MTIRPEQFASKRPPRRIIGTEMEYYANGIGQLDSNQKQQYVAGIGIDRILDGYMTNGALWYYDMGHQEYATAESTGPLEAMRTDHSGIRFMSKLALRAATAPQTTAEKFWAAPQRRSGTYGIEERDVKTKGRHENFQIPTEMLSDAALRLVLSTHLTTQQIIGGAGFQMGERYRISQKAYDIGNEVLIGYGNRTGHKVKPLGSVLDAEDKTGKNWDILEVRFADPSMNPYQTLLNIGSTSLVLRLIEQGIITPENSTQYCIVEPVSAVHSISHHPLEVAKRTYQMQSGEHLTAVDIQRRFAETVKNMLANGVRLPRDEQYVAREWLDVIDKLSHVNHDIYSLEPLFGRLDWATKCLAMHRKGLHTIENRDEYIAKSVAFDLLWSSVSPKGIGNRYAARYGRHYDKLTATQHDYLLTPPQTRSAARAAFIMTDSARFVSWNKATTADNRTLRLNDAYSPELPALSLAREEDLDDKW